MYGNYREEQIAYVNQVIKADGLIIFLEKMSCPDREDYLTRGAIKDKLFKAKYFNAEDIIRKENDILKTMESGQTTLEDFSQAVHRHFKYAYLILNSCNFYQIAASNDEATIQRFLKSLSKPYVPSSFSFEKIREI